MYVQLLCLKLILFMKVFQFRQIQLNIRSFWLKNIILKIYKINIFVTWKWLWRWSGQSEFIIDEIVQIYVFVVCFDFTLDLYWFVVSELVEAWHVIFYIIYLWLVLILMLGWRLRFLLLVVVHPWLIVWQRQEHISEFAVDCWIQQWSCILRLYGWVVSNMPILFFSLVALTASERWYIRFEQVFVSGYLILILLHLIWQQQFSMLFKESHLMLAKSCLRRLDRFLGFPLCVWFAWERWWPINQLRIRKWYRCTPWYRCISCITYLIAGLAGDIEIVPEFSILLHEHRLLRCAPLSLCDTPHLPSCRFMSCNFLPRRNFELKVFIVVVFYFDAGLLQFVLVLLLWFNNRCLIQSKR